MNNAIMLDQSTNTTHVAQCASPDDAVKQLMERFHLGWQLDCHQDLALVKEIFIRRVSMSHDWDITVIAYYESTRQSYSIKFTQEV